MSAFNNRYQLPVSILSEKVKRGAFLPRGPAFRSLSGEKVSAKGGSCYSVWVFHCYMAAGGFQIFWEIDYFVKPKSCIVGNEKNIKTGYIWTEYVMKQVVL